MRSFPIFLKTLLLLIFGLLRTANHAQERFIYNNSNTRLQSYRANHPLTEQKSSAVLDALPFMDDFSSYTSFTTMLPDPSLWVDKYAYINSDLADSLLSIGIATFDAFDNEGLVYDSIGSGRIADYLTSVPINMGKYKATDNLMISFYYQAGGKGDLPNANDSLWLEFYSPLTLKWKRVWAAPKRERKFNAAYYLITGKDSAFTDGFQFRFKNSVSIESENIPGKLSQMDLWHLDYVYLNKNRPTFDSIIHDMVFYKPATSIFNNYTSVPLRHFKTDALKNSELKKELEYSIRKNENYGVSVEKYTDFKDLYNNKKTTDTVGRDNVDATFYHTFFNIQSRFFSTPATKKTTFEIKQYFKAIEDTSIKWNKQWNDTLRYYQVLDNYYAYDDGSSEAGYGLQQYDYIAYAFNSYLSDSINAVQIYFNPAHNDATRQFTFLVYIWDDNKGQPGNFVYESDDKYLKKDTLNRYITFELDSAISVYERFYIGIKQTSSEYPNIGWDLNTNSIENIFINYDGPWRKAGSNNSEINRGSLMIRPIFGNTKNQGSTKGDTKTSLVISPNPAVDNINIQGTTEDNPITKISFYTITGQLFKTIDHPEIEGLPISDLPAGIYFTRLNFSNKTSITVKLLKK